jgi:DNA polymerase-3 subunit delta
MILKWPEAAKRLQTPGALSGLLMYGADAMRVALKRAEAVLSVVGPQGETDMRITRLLAADLRKDASALIDAVKEIGFFPGPRLVLVEDATDGLSETIAHAFRDWRNGDAFVLVTAGALTAKSPLRGLFEKMPGAGAVAFYDDPPTREEIEAELRRAGLSRIEPEAMEHLTALSRGLDPGDFRQTLERIGLYKWQDPGALTSAEVDLLAPSTIDAEVDDLIAACADGNAVRLGGLMRRIEGQGVAPVTICIAALRHFRSLHIAATDPGGMTAGLAKARVFGPRRGAMETQAKQLGRASLETAMALLVETDLTLRSTSKAPTMAVMERALITLSMLRRGR